MNEKILTKLRLRGYRPRARLVEAEIFGDPIFGDGDIQDGSIRIARGVIDECFDYTWQRGETITTTPIQELNSREGWFITRNSLYLVKSWQKSTQQPSDNC